MQPETDLLASVKFVRNFLVLAGHWPDRTPSPTTELRSFLSFASAAIFFTTNLMEILLHFSNFKDLAENLSVTAPVFAFIVKLVVFKLKRREFFRMIDAISASGMFQPLKNDHRVLVETMGRRCVLVMKIYGGICAVVVTLYASLSLMSETVLPIKFTYDFGPWVYGMYVFQMTAIMNVALNTVCLDMLAVCFMGVAVSQLEILEMKILDFVGYEKDERRLLNECVVHHSEIIQYLVVVEDIFNIFFLTQYLSSIFSICNIGFQLANIDPISAQFANMLFYFSAMMLQLAAFCWFGNEIILKSLAIGDACYKTDWLQSSSEIKKSLIIVMTRANRQLAVTAGKFSILSLRSLTSIMNASYSYFALMQRLYKNDQP